MNIYRAPSGIGTHGTHSSVFHVTTVCNTFCKDHFVDATSDTNSGGNDQGPTAGKPPTEAAWDPSCGAASRGERKKRL